MALDPVQFWPFPLLMSLAYYCTVDTALWLEKCMTGWEVKSHLSNTQNFSTSFNISWHVGITCREMVRWMWSQRISFEIITCNDNFDYKFEMFTLNEPKGSNQCFEFRIKKWYMLLQNHYVRWMYNKNKTSLYNVFGMLRYVVAFIKHLNCFIRMRYRTHSISTFTLSTNISVE